MALHRIDPYDLRLFAAVAEAGTITAGASRMHLSLAATSTRLQKLEQATGSLLLLRSKRGVTLTDAGRTLLRHAGRLQRNLESLHADMAAHAQGMSSTVRVLCNTAAMSEYLPPLLGRFLVEHPEVDVDLRELDSQDVLQAMRQQRADIGIVADHVGTEGLVTQDFREDRLVAVLPATDVWRVRRKASLRFAELLDRPFVGLPPDSGLTRFLQNQALHFGRALHHRVCVRSFEAVVDLVAAGVGVAIVPEAAAQRLALAEGRVQVKPLADAWAARRLMLCTAGDETLGAGAALLLAFLAGA